MEKILISACLYGDGIYRYDGKDKASADPLILKWKKEGRLVPVCPEMEGGLTMPRDPAERQGKRVINKKGRDVTTEYERGSSAALEAAYREHVVCAIFKERSPSCGVHEIYDGSHTGRVIPGEGVTSALLRERGIPVFSENECGKVLMFIKSL